MAEQNRAAQEVLEWAAKMGLGKAVQDHPADVLAAADSAVKAREACGVPADPTAEPWPPMQPRIAQ